MIYKPEHARLLQKFSGEIWQPETVTELENFIFQICVHCSKFQESDTNPEIVCDVIFETIAPFVEDNYPDLPPRPEIVINDEGQPTCKAFKLNGGTKAS